MATLGKPVVAAISTAPDSITLSWQSIDGAVEYQIFSYEDGKVEMLDTISGTSAVMTGLEAGHTYRYIVQPISYVEIADNVSGENSVGATCGAGPETAVPPAMSYDGAAACLTLSWKPADNVDTYYIYRYHADANMLSNPKTVTGKTACSYRMTGTGAYAYLVTTAEMSSRKYYDGAGALTVVIPEV